MNARQYILPLARAIVAANYAEAVQAVRLAA